MCGTGFLANIDESCTPPGSEGHCKLLLTRSSWSMRCVICVLAAFSCIDIVRLSYLGLGRVKTLKSESLAPEQILAELRNNLTTENKTRTVNPPAHFYDIFPVCSSP